MGIRENNEKTQIEMNPYIYEPVNRQPDQRVKMIYDRYHTGKPIMMDDLKYLYKKDPEGCEKLARSIVESINGKAREQEPDNPVPMENAKESAENSEDQQNNIDYNTGMDIPRDSFRKILDVMTSVKLVIEKMNEIELMDLMGNLNRDLELKKNIRQMQDWNDTLIDKLAMYTYEEEKVFNMLA